MLLLQTAHSTPAASDEKDDSSEYFWNRFWADAEAVSVDYIRELYARLLVAKRKSSRALSLRTLDVIRCLDEDGAELFRFVCQFLCEGHMLPDLFDTTRDEKPPLNAGHLALLVEYGLVNGELMGRRHPVGPLRIGDWYLKFDNIHCGPFAERTLRYYPLTRAGRELVGIVDAKVSDATASVACRLFSLPDYPHSPRKHGLVSRSPDGPWLEPEHALGTLESDSQPE